MSVSLVPSVGQLLINSEDFTPWLIGWNCTQSPIDTKNGSGVLFVTGQLELADYPAPWNPDVVVNPIFRKGNRVEIRDRAGELLPIGGTLFVETAEWDREAHRVRLNLSCKLGLLNARTPGDLGVCVALRSRFPIGDAAQQLLENAGVTGPFAGFDQVPGFLREPIYVEPGNSLISLAAELLRDNGFCAVQTRTGLIQCFPYTEQSRALVLTTNVENLSEWVQAPTPVLPADTLEIAGENTLYRDNSSTEVLTEYNETLNGSQTLITETRYNSRKIVNRTILHENLNQAIPSAYTTPDRVFVSETVETSEYEEKRAAVDLETCLPDDPGRLRVKTTRVDAALGKALEAAYVNSAEYQRLPVPPLPLTPVTQSTTVERWRYSLPKPQIQRTAYTLNADGDPEPDSVSGGILTNVGKYLEIETVETTLAGVIWPILGKPDLGRSNLSQAADAPAPADQSTQLASATLPPICVQPVTSRYHLVRYQLNPDLTTWRRTEVELLPRCLAEPEQIQAMIATRLSGGEFAYELETVIRAGLELKQVNYRSINKTSLQDPPRFPPEQTGYGQPYRFTVSVSGGSKPPFKRREGFNPGQYGYTPSNGVEIASACLSRSWADSFGFNLTFPLAEAPPDTQCLDRVEVTDGATTYILALNGLTASVERDRAVFAARGLVLGTRIGNVFSPVVSPDAIASFSPIVYHTGTAQVIPGGSILAEAVFSGFPHWFFQAASPGYTVIDEIVTEDDLYFLES